MKKLLINLLCKFGKHNWYSDSELLAPRCDSSKGEVVLIWWQCEHCAKSKLMFISR